MRAAQQHSGLRGRRKGQRLGRRQGLFLRRWELLKGGVEEGRRRDDERRGVLRERRDLGHRRSLQGRGGRKVESGAEGLMEEVIIWSDGWGGWDEEGKNGEDGRKGEDAGRLREREEDEGVGGV